MKTTILSILLLCSCGQLSAQFPYGTALVPAGVELHIIQTDQELIHGVLSEKIIKKIRYNSSMQALILWDDLDFIRMRRSKNFSLRGTKIALNNYMRTYPEGMDMTVFPYPKVPQYPLSFSKEVMVYGPDPCDGGFSQPGDGEYKAILNQKEFYEGIAHHNEITEAMFNVSFTGIQSCNEYLFFNVTAGGTYFENDRTNHPGVEGRKSVLTASFEEKGCRRVWENEKSTSGIILEMYTDQADYSETATPNNAWIGKNGVYKRSETVEEEGEIVNRREELYLMKIDTAEFFDYIREKPDVKRFVANGRHFSVVESDGFVKSTDIIYNMVITLGKPDEFIIAASNKEEYENWMPGHEDYSGSWSPVAFKAEFMDETEADSICFKLQAVSHLPGICTNYPILPKDAPEEKPDMYFAPQDQQTDPAIIVLNDTVALTNGKVRSAEIVVLSRDFGAHAEITATSVSTGKMAQSKPDQLYFVEIPFDENGNLIADAWEQQMGTEGLGKNTDDDHLPAGIKDKGDGLTAFEEYRGFISLKDVKAPSDPKHTQRNGSHIRTSPFCRDVFIYDANGLFAKYFESFNPAECHWHYLSSDQIKLPDPQEVYHVVYAGNLNLPDTSDHSSEADAIRTKLDIASTMMSEWLANDYRRININSPERYRNNMQYAMYLLESPLDKISDGLSIPIGDDRKIKRSPLEAFQLIVIPKFSRVKEASLNLFDLIISRWDHPVFKTFYPYNTRLELVQRMYEAMIPHEIGHGLGIEHHQKGKMLLIDENTRSKVLVPDEKNKLVETVAYKEYHQDDGKSYNIQSISSALLAFGIDECCMRYTTEREIDFVTMRVLKPSTRFCKKGQVFINGNGKPTEADDCFGSIKIRCEN